jgi:hypothetical protein
MNLEEFISATEGEEILEINNLFLIEEGLREGKLSGINGPVSKEVIAKGRIWTRVWCGEKGVCFLQHVKLSARQYDPAFSIMGLKFNRSQRPAGHFRSHKKIPASHQFSLSAKN